MLLQPRKTKFKKFKKRFIRQQFLETKNNKVRVGSIGLKLVESCRLSAKSLESYRRVISRDLGRKGKIWINVFPDLGVSAKPSENRMGKGKGSISYWACVIKAGTVLFQIEGVPIQESIATLNSVSYKIPVKSCIVFNKYKIY